MKRKVVTCAMGVIAVHLAVTLVHGFAHGRLEIGLNAAQEIFVWANILAAPLVAAFLLWKEKLRAGGALLAASMAGALVFGVYFHFIAPGADNVSHEFPLGLASWKHLFDLTAAAIAGLEALGTILGIVLVLNSGTQESKA